MSGCSRGRIQEGRVKLYNKLAMSFTREMFSFHHLTQKEFGGQINYRNAWHAKTTTSTPQ